MLFNDCVCFQLSKTVKQVSKAYRNEIKSFNLTHGQFFMIVAIIEEEGLLPSELAEKTSQDRATTTGLLDRLEKDDWIERRADKSDRRSLRIFLTEHGRSKSDELSDLFSVTNRKFMDLFSEGEWNKLHEFLSRMR